MKKFIYIFAGLLVVPAMLFAQSNVGVVNETGTDHNATIEQNGKLNTSYVTQTNKENTATIKQSNYNKNLNTYSDVNQSGKDNDASVEQTSNGLLVPSLAYGSLKTVVNQSGDKNEAVQVQGPHLQQGVTYGEIIQGGNNNYASQHQVKFGNDARINQSGNGNSAEQAQDTKLLPDDEGSFNKAVANQSGNLNLATQEQQGATNDALIDQSGRSNKADQYQKGILDVVRAYQSGNGNTSTQDQRTGFNLAEVNQSGNNNSADQSQDVGLILGGYNKASIDQSGMGNSSIQKQFGATSTAIQIQKSGIDDDILNKAEIRQWGGKNNDAEQYQTTCDALNDAVIMQNGSSNSAIQYQFGGSNMSSISQEGMNHTAVVTQTMP